MDNYTDRKWRTDLVDAWRLWKSTQASDPTIELSDRLVRKTSLPIYRMEDPRLKYKRKELDNFAVIDKQDLELLDD